MALLFGVRRRELSAPIAVLGTAVALLFSILGLQRALVAEGPIRYELGGWPPPIGIEYVLDPLAGIFLIIISAFGLLSVIYGRATIAARYDRSQPFYYSLVLLLLAGLAGIVVTGDVFNLFVFLEISSLTTYALVAIGGPKATVAAFRYLVIGTVAACFYLIGVGFLFYETGTLNLLHMAGLLPEIWGAPTLYIGLALIVVGIGIKAAIFPMHVWLPDAYAYAPAPITAMIAAMSTKVSAYVIIRVLFWLMDAQVIAAETPVMTWLLWFSLAGIVIASAQALPQVNVRRMLAYSSVAQLGYIGVGIALATPLALSAMLLHVINHAIIKGGLFYAVGAMEQRSGMASINGLRGMARAMPWTAAAVVVAGISLIGLPVTGGFFSKWYLLRAALLEAEWGAAVIMLLGGLLTVGYVFRIIRYMYLTPVETGEGRTGGDLPQGEPPLAMMGPAVLMAVATIGLGFFNVYVLASVVEPALPAVF